MRETKYKILTKNDGKVEITAQVSDYKFVPEGTQEDWVKYAKNQLKQNKWNSVDVFMEYQDKETGYCNRRLIHTIV